MDKFSAHLGKYLGVWLLDYTIKVNLVLEETTSLSSKVAAPFAFPPAMNESSCCSPSSSAFGVISVLHFSHSNLMALICNSLWHMMLNIFLCACLQRWGIQIFCPFFLQRCWPSYCWVFRVIFIIWIQVLHQICILQIFSLGLWFLSSISLQWLPQSRNFNFSKI